MLPSIIPSTGGVHAGLGKLRQRQRGGHRLHDRRLQAHPLGFFRVSPGLPTSARRRESWARDWGYRPAGESAAADGDVRRRARIRCGVRVRRSSGGLRDHRGLRGRQLLSEQSGHAAPDGQLPGPGARPFLQLTWRRRDENPKNFAHFDSRRRSLPPRFGAGRFAGRAADLGNHEHELRDGAGVAVLALLVSLCVGVFRPSETPASPVRADLRCPFFFASPSMPSGALLHKPRVRLLQLAAFRRQLDPSAAL